ncbi:MAG: metallophosphoesterase [Thermotogota bacterium]|nr:metallophosphoesterase [Thermotogota bacterium]
MKPEKNNAREKLEILLVADVHMGPSNTTRPGEETPDLMERFAKEINTVIKPDILVELGDRVNNFNHEEDRRNALRFSEIIRSLCLPYYLVLGNHDLHNLTKEENKEIFGAEVGRRTSYANGFKLIFLDTEEPVIEGVGGNISEEQLKWLSVELNSEETPKIVFGHHPVDNQVISENPHFLQFPHLAFVKNRERARDLIESGKNVLAYVNGHVHWFSFEVGEKIPFISVPSFTEAWPEKKEAPGMFAKLSVSMNGNVEVAVGSLSPRRTLGKFLWTKQH